MDVAALVVWVVTALGGLTMAGMWVAGDGPAQHHAGVSRIAPGRLAAHFGLAATGLLLWIGYVATDHKAPGVIALVLLPLVALLGFLLFMTWLAGRGAAVTGPGDEPAEQRFPVVIVAAHGVFAVLTLLAVLVAVLS